MFLVGTRGSVWYIHATSRSFLIAGIASSPGELVLCLRPPEGGTDFFFAGGSSVAVEVAGNAVGDACSALKWKEFGIRIVWLDQSSEQLLAVEALTTTDLNSFTMRSNRPQHHEAVKKLYTLARLSPNKSSTGYDSSVSERKLFYGFLWGLNTCRPLRSEKLTCPPPAIRNQ
jgi:hypothetical protein